MSKQIIGDVFGELLQTSKKAGKQLVKLPGEMVEDAVRQSGIKTVTPEQGFVTNSSQPESGNNSGQDGAVNIQKLKEEDEKKKRREIAIARNLLEMQKTPSVQPLTVQEQERREQEKMARAASQEEKNQLPALAPTTSVGKKGHPSSAALNRKIKKVEVKGSVSG